ncbi:hypothetical protein BDZ97DRAFT_1902409 [Flammula alnicola]|nr:hypothetical protein BDZ97DRAFT_1902409 [Flammula alnicola]
MQPTGDPSIPFPCAPEIVDNALLLATLPSLTVPHFLTPVISYATTHTRKRLIIILFSRHFNVHYKKGTGKKTQLTLTFPEIQALPHTKMWDAVQRILTFTYVQATKIAQEMNKVLMDIDVLLKGMNEDLEEEIAKGVDICFRVDGGTSLSDSPNSTAACIPRHCTWGTFDHLHAGHKILLSMGAYITSRKLIVGITDDALLKNKANQHVLEKLPTRIQKVYDFLKFFKPEIVADIVPINDVYGPTGWDPDIQALVVSRETLGGAEAIAKHREAHNLPALQTFLIDVISATEMSLDHEDEDWLKAHKLSSTFIRQWIVDNNKQEEEEGEEEEKEKEKEIPAVNQ